MSEFRDWEQTHHELASASQVRPDELDSIISANRARTLADYRRLNPWYEDVVQWSEKARVWFGEDRGITIYESTTLNGSVDIGENSWVGPFCSLDGSGGLTIGRSCSISAGVQILTHDTVRWALSGGELPYEYSSVVIGDFCFIGTNAVLTKGVHIGPMSVVGAGAVVTRSFPERSVIGGVPARRIGRVTGSGQSIRLDFSDKEME